MMGRSSPVPPQYIWGGTVRSRGSSRSAIGNVVRPPTAAYPRVGYRWRPHSFSVDPLKLAVDLWPVGKKQD
eukprot:6380040-Prymnesium_polylepis.1